MNDPDGFYYSRITSGSKASNAAVAAAAMEVQKIKNSNSYKLGFALTSIPRKIKKKLKALKKKLKS